MRFIRYAEELQLIATGRQALKPHGKQVSCLILSFRTFLWSIALLLITFYARRQSSPDPLSLGQAWQALR